MERTALMKQWPQNGGDAARAKALVELGYPSVAPVLDDMVGWLKGQNEASAVFQDFLARLGEPGVPAVRAALHGLHELQIEHILRHVLPHWTKSAIAPLVTELEQLLQRPSISGLHVLALALIVKHQLPTHAPVAEWLELFLTRVQGQMDELRRIASLMRPS